MRRVALAVLITACLLPSTMLLAGAQARIKGQVTDSKGNPIPGATITITTEDIENYKKVVKTDSKGHYSVLILDATHRYLFTVEAEGFIGYKEYVKAPVGEMNYKKDFVLKTVQEVQEEEKAKILQQPGFKEAAEGRELLEQGKVDEALAKFEEAVKFKPELVGAWHAIAKIKYDKGDFNGSLAACQSCLEQDPESVECLAVAINAAKKLGKTELYQEYMKRYQELNPDDPATIFNQAVQYINKLDDEHARPLLEKCLEVDPDFPDCLYHLGLVLLRANDIDGCKEKLKHLLEVAPDYKDAEIAKQVLNSL